MQDVNGFPDEFFKDSVNPYNEESFSGEFETFDPEFFDDIIEDRTIEDDVRLTNGLENHII